MRALRIGLVCPYGWDAPGGVQNHIKDLAEYLIAQGHYVSVLAPVVDETDLPDFVVSAGKPLAIPYNGAVARILFGPAALARVRQWITHGSFDLLHLHEPAIPSLSLLACSVAEGPMVGTFHAAAKKQRAIYAIGPILDPIIEKLSARIAVSEAARETLTDHFKTDALVIPNGIYVDNFACGKEIPEWSGNTLGFIGRFEEPRKGLPVLIEALPIIARFAPDVRVIVAGPGDGEKVKSAIDHQLRDRFTFIGRISDEAKADFMASVGIYVAPNTGGESFGIILAEALAAGAPVLASNIPAFDSLLGQGRYGELFENEDSEDLARKAIDLLRNHKKRMELSAAGQIESARFDWKVVAEQVFDVYEMAMVGSAGVHLGKESRGWGSFIGKGRE